MGTCCGLLLSSAFLFSHLRLMLERTEGKWKLISFFDACRYDLNPKNESAFREKQDKIVWRGSPDGIYVGRDQKCVFLSFPPFSTFSSR